MKRKRARARGEGSIYPRQDGRWVASLRWPDGTRKDRYRKTQRAAVAALSELRALRDAGQPPPDDQLTVGKFLDGWMASHVARLAPATQANYQRAMEHVGPELRRQSLRTLSVRQVAAWLDGLEERGVGRPSVVLFLVVLRSALTEAMREDLIQRNPASLVRTPKYRPKKGRPLSAEEATGLITAVRSHRLRALIVLALTSAMRIGELLGLTWDAVHLDEAYLEVRQQVRRVKGKGVIVLPVKTERSEAPVVLTALAVRALKEHRAKLIEARMRSGDVWRGADNPAAADALVFPSRVGTVMDPVNAWRIWSGMLQDAKIEHRRLHDSRGTTATLLRAMGIPQEVVQAILRHARYTTTADYYVKTDLSQQRDAAAKLDELLGEVLG